MKNLENHEILVLNFDAEKIDDLIIYKIKEESYLFVVNASNIKKDWRLDCF